MAMKVVKAIVEMLDAAGVRLVFLAMAGTFALLGLWLCLLPPRNFGPLVALFALAAVFLALAVLPSNRR